MRVLVACEYSGRVRDAFLARGHAAISCDLLPSESPNGPHLQEPLEKILSSTLLVTHYDLLIGFPPCTDLAVSGARWWPAKRANGRQQRSIDFFLMLAESSIRKIAIENPIGIMSTVWRKPDQIIQPWMFGHGETKATCLWLKGLPKLVATNIVNGREPRVHRMPPGPNRWKERSLTYQGVAEAMANQWG